MDVWYPLTPGAQPVPATTVATQQLQLISPPPSAVPSSHQSVDISPSPPPIAPYPLESPPAAPETHTSMPTLAPTPGRNAARKRARYPSPPHSTPIPRRSPPSPFAAHIHPTPTYPLIHEPSRLLVRQRPSAATHLSPHRTH
eukprot:scaffold11899_cov133-Isochrysis_galbana.AAC.4